MVSCRWRDVPEAYEPAKTIYNRYHRWSQRRIWQRMFEKMAATGLVPMELSIDSTHVKAHRSAQAQKGSVDASDWHVARWKNKQNPLFGR
jgi:transposase